MRRIYESDALHRDEDDPHSPSELEREEPKPTITANQNPSFLNWARASHALLPVALRNRAIDVAVETDREVYAPDEPVRIRVRFRNRVPFPIALRTPTRRQWDWSVGGFPRGAHEEFEPVPADASLLEFYRSETKTFARTWHQRFRTADDRWEVADPGTYEVAAFVAVETPDRRGLRAATDIELTD